jgi:hypothetical protein
MRRYRWTRPIGAWTRSLPAMATFIAQESRAPQPAFAQILPFLNHPKYYVVQPSSGIQDLGRSNSLSKWVARRLLQLLNEGDIVTLEQYLT